MKIDKDALINYINNLKITRDISFREIERQSGVHNVSRIVSGDIKNPTAESWQLLHDAFPNDIPEPHYIKGGKVFKNVVTGNGNISAAGGSQVANITKGEILSTSEQMLIDSLRRLGEKKDMVILDLLGIVATEIKKISE